MNKRTTVIINLVGDKCVYIKNNIFSGKRNIRWKDVELYLRKYVGKCYQITETNECIYIGSDFPDEYANSKYTYKLKGARAKAKANAVQGLPEMLEVAFGKQYEKNRKIKHHKDAKYGWYRYESRFALPVSGGESHKEQEKRGWNIFHAIILVRHARDGKLYLYDILDIKKETSNLFRSEDFTQ